MHGITDYLDMSGILSCCRFKATDSPAVTLCRVRFGTFGRRFPFPLEQLDPSRHLYDLTYNNFPSIG